MKEHVLGLALQEDEILVPAPGTNMKEGLGHNLHLILSWLNNMLSLLLSHYQIIDSVNRQS